MLIENGAWNCLYLIDIQSLVDYHAKVQSDPLKSRVNYGMRDSFVFFGKILSSLAVANQEYVKSEFYYWWRNNWHRVSMYLSRDETNGWAVLGVSLRYRRLFFHIFLSLFPWWKIKEILKPIPLSRETQCPDRK
jgi:hypothetical protein